MTGVPATHVPLALHVSAPLHWFPSEQLAPGSGPRLVSLAFQDPDGLWQLLESRADADAQTITAETTHFTDFSPMTRLRIVPPRAEVKVEEFVGFTVESCTNLGERQNGEIAYAYRCSRASSFVIPHLGSWAVNGVPGGNSTFGFAGGTFVEKMSFEAPQEVPTPDEVKVHLDFTELDGSPSELATHVKILPARGDYSGTLNFSNTSSSTGHVTTGATAEVDWIADMANAQFESYNASGSIAATVTFHDCDPEEVSFPILAGTLVYYPTTSAVYKNHHVFAVAAAGDADFRCGMPRKTETKQVALTFPISSCLTEPIPAPSADNLSGTYDCDDLNEEHGDWSFTRRAPFP